MAGSSGAIAGRTGEVRRSGGDHNGVGTPTMYMGEPIRVAVANDYELVIAGLAAMLQPYQHRVEVADAVLVGQPVSEPVDVVLYDTFGRVEAASDAVNELLSTGNVGQVVVYTRSPRP